MTRAQKTSKISLVVLIIILGLSFAAFVNSLILWDWFKISMATSALVLYFVPLVLANKFKIAMPVILEITYYLYIFSALILGEVFAFYGPFLWWDVVLHGLGGFLLAGVGYALAQNLIKTKPNKIFVLFFAFCFSMTLGVAWECLEFSFDQIVRTDAQKDTHLTNISTITLQRDGGNKPVHLNEIEKEEIYLRNGEIITIDEGHLDVGNMDTMKDLLVNTAGALAFVMLMAVNKNLANYFIPTKK